MEYPIEFVVTEDDEAMLSELNIKDLELIDHWILQSTTHKWQKVAMVENGKLGSQGNVRAMRFSEIKLGP